jgi:bleomycin hydrolase
MLTLSKSTPIATPNGAITPGQIEQHRADFAGHPTTKIAQNAIASGELHDVALNRDVVTSTDFTFSTLLDEWEVTAQKQSGRCWMFAAMNLFRVAAMKKMNLANFEFSQNYTFFWDKFERANWFLQQIIDTAALPQDDRTVGFLLDSPLDDGGQWNMFMNLVRKHGLVPQAVMPETISSSKSRPMNSQVNHKLRGTAQTLRTMHARGATAEELDATRHKAMDDIWRMLCLHLGTPPTSFDWQWNDKDKVFHRNGTMTPLSFAEKYVDLPLDEYVCLVHDPRESSPFGKTFTVDRLGNVVGGESVIYLNIEIDLMKSIACDVLESGEPVWFGCDVGPQMHRELGLWDAKLFDYPSLYDTDYALDKAGRLEYHQSAMTHAMLFTGVDVVDGAPRRWRVENSWGAEKSGRKGYYTMNDSWFDEYMFEIAARKSLLPENLQTALDQEPIVLPAWDPMGSLARSPRI